MGFVEGDERLEREVPMAEDLKQAVKKFSDEELVAMITRDRKDFTDEAITIIERELEARGVDEEKRKALMDEPEEPVHHDREKFQPLEHKFGHTDLLLVSAMLKENKIPYFADAGTNTSDIIPTEAITERTYRLHVLEERLQEVQTMVDEHFTWVDGVYRLKAQNTKDQIKALNFFDLGLEGLQLDDTVEVEFSSQEQHQILHLAKRLENDVDRLEQEEGRTVFHYDNLEGLVGKLESAGKATWTVGDVLTILEVLQIYCDAEDFPAELEETIAGLLEFFKLS